MNPQTVSQRMQTGQESRFEFFSISIFFSKCHWWNCETVLFFDCLELLRAINVPSWILTKKNNPPPPQKKKEE